jgi:uncharacterized membrane protein YeaQ/YmgE (transglycosylase-associated protein family)
MEFIWTIIIGFIAGVIAKFIMPGPNEPQGFILTAILGIVGAFVATYLGQVIVKAQASSARSSVRSSCSRSGASSPAEAHAPNTACFAGSMRPGDLGRLSCRAHGIAINVRLLIRADYAAHSSRGLDLLLPP